METTTKVLLWVGGIITTGLVILGIVEEAKAAPASGGGGGGGGLGGCPPGSTPTTTLTPGHRYGFQAACPFAFPLGLPPVGSTAAVAALIGVTGVSIFKYSPAADNKSFSAIFDFTGVQTTLPAIQSGGSTACATLLCDMGLTSAQQQGGVQNQNLTLPANAAGPYTLQTPTAGSYTLLNGNVYLIEAPPIPSQTLAQTVDSLLALYPNLKPASGTAEANSWDVGQVPQGWPDSDATVRRVAVIVSIPPPAHPQLVHMSITFPAPATTKVWLATG